MANSDSALTPDCRMWSLHSVSQTFLCSCNTRIRGFRITVLNSDKADGCLPVEWRDDVRGRRDFVPPLRALPPAAGPGRAPVGTARTDTPSPPSEWTDSSDTVTTLSTLPEHQSIHYCISQIKLVSLEWTYVEHGSDFFGCELLVGVVQLRVCRVECS